MLSLRGLRSILAASAFVTALATAGCSERIDGGPPVVAVPADPWVVAAPTDPAAAELFASCASCHMADGSGRSDGTIPRLAGQSEAVLVHKLAKLRDGTTFLPVMTAFARSLTEQEVRTVARYAATLPTTTAGIRPTDGGDDYRAVCAACHGPAGEGNDALLAPRLCGQYAPYLVRRMAESAANARGDADPAMAAIVANLPDATRQRIAAWLAAGDCGTGADS
jgi:cytochrome c553